MSKHPRQGKAISATANPQGSDLEKFARAFKNEAELRGHIATLLRKMGRQEVRITHGPSERGKDIVFYGPSGLDNRSLFACVVKNDRIVGDVSSRSAAQVVFHQAEQAFREPYRNPSTGRPERVKTVYVISAHEASTGAIDSIGEALSATGAVEFVCGARLLDLFATHWRSFLQFESDVLVSYLSALRSSLQQDRALIELVLRQSILPEIPSGFESMYVPQGFGEQLVETQTAAGLLRPLQIPTTQVKLSQLAAVESVVRELAALTNYLGKSDRLDGRTEGGYPPVSVCDHLLTAVREDWKMAYESYVGRLVREHAKLPKELRGAAAPQVPSQRQAVLDVELRTEARMWLERAELLRKEIANLLAADCSASNALAKTKISSEAIIKGEAFLAFCRLQNLQENAQGAVLFDTSKLICNVSVEASFLGNGIPVVLLVGPAGFGKTSFCKWQSLCCAGDLLDQRGDVLPVYVPLYKFASYLPTNVDEAFFESPELRHLLADSSRKTRIRLFLDGLDEVPDPQRQHAIINLARSVIHQLPDSQIVITARDHVKGAWLDGLPKLRVSPLNHAQQHKLVENWLGSAAATDRFFEQLLLPIRQLMGVPLLATLTAAVYKKHQYLPANRTALYSLFVELLCGGWDAVKGTNRGSRFGIHDKQLVLKTLAGMNHLAGRRDASPPNFKAAVRASLSGLIEHADDLLSEMLQDGLIVHTGAGVRFSHLSFQEFMGAEYLKGPKNDRLKLALRMFFSGDDWWTEVLIYYVTNTVQPAEMEGWLIERARAFTRTARAESVLSGRIDERLNLLRKALRDAFPAYRSQYPEDGITIEKRRSRSGDDVMLEETRRRLSGARL